MVVRRNSNIMRWVVASVAVFMVMICSHCVLAVQVQDLVRIKGSESSKLVGTGLVVGLNGTGDGKFSPSMRRLVTLMNHLGDPTARTSDLKDASNVALVTVVATLPNSGVREGDKVNVQIASIGAAKSLVGGRLFMTPLYPPVPDPNAPVFAYAEGPITIENEDVPTVATVVGGAAIVRDVIALSMDEHGRMTLVLNQANATWPMSTTIATLVNDIMAPDGPSLAMAHDPKNIIIQVPEREWGNPGTFISQILETQLDSSLVRTEARVIINQRTGTIVMTGNVQMSPVVISHESLTITTITPQPKITPENPKIDQHDFVGIDPTNAGGNRFNDLLAAFNQLKVPMQDRIDIIKEISKTGRLHARLILED